MISLNLKKNNSILKKKENNKNFFTTNYNLKSFIIVFNKYKRTGKENKK